MLWAAFASLQRQNPANTKRLRLDKWRRDVFGRPDVDATPEFAVLHAIQEIDHQSNSEPYHKTNPGHHRQAQHQSQTHDDTENRKNRDEGHAKWTRSFGVNAAQHVDSEANQNKREERADIGEICQLTNVRNHGHAGDHYSSPDR